LLDGPPAVLANDLARLALARCLCGVPGGVQLLQRTCQLAHGVEDLGLVAAAATALVVAAVGVGVGRSVLRVVKELALLAGREVGVPAALREDTLCVRAGRAARCLVSLGRDLGGARARGVQSQLGQRAVRG